MSNVEKVLKSYGYKSREENDSEFDYELKKDRIIAFSESMARDILYHITGEVDWKNLQGNTIFLNSTQEVDGS